MRESGVCSPVWIWVFQSGATNWKWLEMTNQNWWTGNKMLARSVLEPALSLYFPIPQYPRSPQPSALSPCVWWSVNTASNRMTVAVTCVNARVGRGYSNCTITVNIYILSCILFYIAPYMFNVNINILVNISQYFCYISRYTCKYKFPVYQLYSHLFIKEPAWLLASFK